MSKRHIVQEQLEISGDKLLTLGNMDLWIFSLYKDSCNQYISLNMYHTHFSNSLTSFFLNFPDSPMLQQYFIMEYFPFTHYYDTSGKVVHMTYNGANAFCPMCALKDTVIM